jgi:hypothetical protein
MRLVEPDLPETEMLRASQLVQLMSIGTSATALFAMSIFALVTRGFTSLPSAIGSSATDKAILWAVLVGSLTLTIWSVKTMKPQDNWLALTRQGFTVHTLRSEEFFRWIDVEKFGILDEHRTKGVIFTFSVASGRPSTWQAKGRGYDGKLPNTYGMTHTDLRAYLTLWHDRATVDHVD